MQNFLTSTDFSTTAKNLDRYRLGKQRLETADCLALLLGQPEWMSDAQYGYITKKYGSHPAVPMWSGYEYLLITYGQAIVFEWVCRGNQDIYALRFEHFWDMLNLTQFQAWQKELTPDWLTERFCSVHRSVLLGKAKQGLELGKRNGQEVYEWYQQFNWPEKPATYNGRWPYVWPGHPTYGSYPQ